MFSEVLGVALDLPWDTLESFFPPKNDFGVSLWGVLLQSRLFSAPGWPQARKKRGFQRAAHAIRSRRRSQNCPFYFSTQDTTNMKNESHGPPFGTLLATFLDPLDQLLSQWETQFGRCRPKKIMLQSKPEKSCIVMHFLHFRLRFGGGRRQRRVVSSYAFLLL